jgi:hypothetical protein
MAAFVARASSPLRAVATDEPAAPTALAATRTQQTAIAKSATISIPVPPAHVDGGWRSKTVKRADGRQLRKQTFYLDAAISHRLAQHCAKYRYEQSTAVERAVVALLEACGD